MSTHSIDINIWLWSVQIYICCLSLHNVCLSVFSAIFKLRWIQKLDFDMESNCNLPLYILKIWGADGDNLVGEWEKILFHNCSEHFDVDTKCIAIAKRLKVPTLSKNALFFKPFRECKLRNLPWRKMLNWQRHSKTNCIKLIYCIIQFVV